MSERLRVGVFIGRMQPPHKAHLDMISKMIEENDHSIVFVGSTVKSTKNPFSFQQVRGMLLCEMPEEFFEAHHNDFQIVPLDDFPSDVTWKRETAAKLDFVLNKVYGNLQPYDVTLYGCNKDDSSYYLKLFPEWLLHEFPVLHGKISSTHIRDLMYNKDIKSIEELHQAGYIGDYTAKTLKDFMNDIT